MTLRKCRKPPLKLRLFCGRSLQSPVFLEVLEPQCEQGYQGLSVHHRHKVWKSNFHSFLCQFYSSWTSYSRKVCLSSIVICRHGHTKGTYFYSVKGDFYVETIESSKPFIPTQIANAQKEFWNYIPSPSFKLKGMSGSPQVELASAQMQFWKSLIDPTTA